MILALWFVPGCLVPPEVEVEAVNLVPELDWDSTIPGDFLLLYNRDNAEPLSFSLVNAVSDPEDDQIYYVWFWQVQGDESPRASVGYATLVDFRPCDFISVKNAAVGDVFYVGVAISDEYIKFDPFGEDFPIEPVERTVLTRYWTVELTGNCP